MSGNRGSTLFVLIEIDRHDRKRDSIQLKYALISKTFFSILSFSIIFFHESRINNSEVLVKSIKVLKLLKRNLQSFYVIFLFNLIK